MVINYVDVAIAVILLLFLWRGFCLGFLAEISSLAGIFVGFYIAKKYADPLSVYLLDYVAKEAAILASFIAIVLAVMVAFSILARLLRWILKISFASWIDYLFGAVFGIAKGCLILSILIHFIEKLSGHLLVENSIFLPYYTKVLELIEYFLKYEF